MTKATFWLGQRTLMSVVYYFSGRRVVAPPEYAVVSEQIGFLGEIAEAFVVLIMPVKRSARSR